MLDRQVLILIKAHVGKQMNNDSDNLFLIIIAFIAGFIILQLRRTLGRKDGYDGKDEKPSHNPFEEHKPKSKTPDDNVVHIHGDKPEKVTPEESYTQSKDLGVAKSSPFYDTIEKIGDFDRGFTVPIFFDGAEYAYGMILNAFWQGDMKTLKTFLNRDVCGQFEDAIDNMKDQGHVFHNVLNDVEKIELEDASLDGSMAELTVRYKSHMTIAIKDEDGNIIDGDEDKIVPVIDIWTFCRDVKRGDPNWTLVSTSNA
jgi:predicted lipid-binding transport protein (Tim44 family)